MAPLRQYAHGGVAELPGLALTWRHVCSDGMYAQKRAPPTITIGASITPQNLRPRAARRR